MSSSPLANVVRILFQLMAPFADAALGRISSQPRATLHPAILALSGVMALTATAAGSLHVVGQHSFGSSSTSYPSRAQTDKSNGGEPPRASTQSLVLENQTNDSNGEASPLALAQFDATSIDPIQSTPSIDASEADRPHPSSRTGERPRDDAIGPVPQKKPLAAFSYQVSAGDTLLELAQRFGVSSDTIVWANDLDDGGDFLQIGQSLTILPISGVLHRVKDGDSVLGIAFAHEASPEDIIEANALEDPNLLRLDQQIIVPRGRPVPPPAPVPPLIVIEHQVRPDETVSDIALMHEVEPIAIVRANGLANPDAIVQGQQLKVPGGKTVEVRAEPAGVDRASSAPAASRSAQAPPPAPAPQQSSPPAPPVEPSNKGNEIVATASPFAGGKYLWGGHSPSTGFDCSGFTWYIYKQVGINIPQHDLWGQIRAGRAVKRDELLPGDLVFFQNTYQPGLSHSGIYVGNGRFISAASEGAGIRFDRLDDPYWGPRYFGASRPW